MNQCHSGFNASYYIVSMDNSDISWQVFRADLKISNLDLKFLVTMILNLLLESGMGAL